MTTDTFSYDHMVLFMIIVAVQVTHRNLDINLTLPYGWLMLTVLSFGCDDLYPFSMCFLIILLLLFAGIQQ